MPELLPDLDVLWRAKQPEPPFLQVTAQHICSVLKRAIAGEISDTDLKDWAIEIARFSTSHLLYKREDERAARAVIFELSETEQVLSVSELQLLLKTLSQ